MTQAFSIYYFRPCLGLSCHWIEPGSLELVMSGLQLGFFDSNYTWSGVSRILGEIDRAFLSYCLASFNSVLVLGAKLCPEGMEATLSATLMSISNGGSVVGGLIGAGLTQLFSVAKDKFDNLATLIILCNLSSLLPLPLPGLLPRDDDSDTVSKENVDIEMKSN
ncbi:hypothetical protein CRYUN_Cryun10bG0046300 [Craigia yunnanensis]